MRHNKFQEEQRLTETLNNKISYSILLRRFALPQKPFSEGTIQHRLDYNIRTVNNNISLEYTNHYLKENLKLYNIHNISKNLTFIDFLKPFTEDAVLEPHKGYSTV